MQHARLYIRAGLALLDRGLAEDAATAFETALSIDPEDPTAQLDLAFAKLAAGQWREGWKLLEARTRARPDNATAVPVSYPAWRGEPLSGKRLLVWTEQGLGDQIMLGRFIKQLRDQGAHVTAACWAPIAPLMEQLASAVIAAGPNQALSVPRHDYWTRYFDLPRWLDVTPETVPSRPYIAAPADRLTRWAGYAGQVGVMWRTSSNGEDAHRRNMPEDQARRLLDAGFVDLRPESTGAVDFADTAAILAHLRHVVSIDTSVAHLAGAMGRPTTILLPAHGADWKWLREPTETVWYPTATLLRQPAPGDWASSVMEVLRRLT